MKHAHLIVPRTLVAGSASGELLYAPTGLSFWGGVDPRSAEVIDRHHPLSGRHLHGRLLAIPGGRGSCTGSSVLLELILGGRAPAAILLREPDEILALGAIVAEELFGRSLPIACLGERFDELAAYPWARLADGRLELHRDAPPPLEARPAEALATDAGPRLDAFDQALLAGEHGEAARLAMRIVLRMAALQGAQRLIDIQRAHIDACIYTGPAGLRFAETLRDLGARVRVPTTLNAISVDQRRWREQGVPAALGEPAAALARAYLDMGAQPSFTCAPYLLDDSARAGEQIVWAESNAVLFANSVLGARTNKYADFMDICCALTGRAPLAGCHLDEQRQARVLIEVEDLGSVDDAFYPTLGYLCGLLCDGQTPAIDGLRQRQPDHDALKAFGAALGTSSSVPMFHVIGVTPEAPDLASAFGGRAPRRTLRVGRERLRDAWRELDSAGETRIDLVALGNPHFSASEFAQLAALCHGRRRHPEVALVITSSRQVVAQAEAAGHLATLQAFGARLVTDTCWCMLDEPLVPPGARTLMTNSAKYAHYAPGLVGRQVRFAGCVEAAVGGRAPAGLPAWLSEDC
ncbi:TPA: aconitase family protein [Pseudomonas aeruginosa]|nr:aconitase family protein [Pseudomonas aeruginosa]